MKEECRVCNGASTFLFAKTHLGKYKVKYFQCLSCGSLQTEAPYWIQEAYATSHYCIDTGICDRGRLTAQRTLALALLRKFDKEDICIDIGGGSGLLTRHLRDFGLNAFWEDKYAENIFAVGFERVPTSNEQIKLLTAFEVLEHFTEPQKEIARLMACRPNFFFFSTKLYKGQGSDWWYFLNDGQHVQLYSKEGLWSLAKKHNYCFYTDGDSFHLFTKERQEANIMKKMAKLGPKSEIKAKEKWGCRIFDDHKKLLALFE